MLLMSGAATVAVAYSSTVPQLIALRLIAGLGLGALMAALAPLVGEYSPRRHRTLILALIFSAGPLGPVIGGLISAAVMEGARDGKTVAELRVILTDLTVHPRYSAALEVRHRFLPSMYGLVTAGREHFPQAEGHLRHGFTAGLGLVRGERRTRQVVQPADGMLPVTPAVRGQIRFVENVLLLAASYPLYRLTRTVRRV